MRAPCARLDDDYLYIPGIILIPGSTYCSRNYSGIIDTGLRLYIAIGALQVSACIWPRTAAEIKFVSSYKSAKAHIIHIYTVPSANRGLCNWRLRLYTRTIFISARARIIRMDVMFLRVLALTSVFFCAVNSAEICRRDFYIQETINMFGACSRVRFS